HSQGPIPWISHGQCVEHYGPGEAFLPVLDTLSRLCGESRDAHLLTLLSQYAPTWLGQMPWLMSQEVSKVRRDKRSAVRERMLRELAEVLEALTVATPLVLFIEDLQWSDYSTLDLLAFLARRREPAQLLLIGTYRPGDVLVSGHPLQALHQELQVHGA